MSLLMAAVVPQPGLAARPPISRRESQAPNAWHARYMSGTLTVQKRGRTVPLTEESHVRVRVENDQILVFKKARMASIPASAVTWLGYRAERYSRSRKVFGRAGAGQAILNCGAGDPRAGAACVMVALPLLAATAPFHYREHFIHITWRTDAPPEGENDNSDQEMELRVGKGQFRSLIAALERATGKKCERIEPQTDAK